MKNIKTLEELFETQTLFGDLEDVKKRILDLADNPLFDTIRNTDNRPHDHLPSELKRLAGIGKSENEQSKNYSAYESMYIMGNFNGDAKTLEGVLKILANAIIGGEKGWDVSKNIKIENNHYNQRMMLIQKPGLGAIGLDAHGAWKGSSREPKDKFTVAVFFLKDEDKRIYAENKVTAGKFEEVKKLINGLNHDEILKLSEYIKSFVSDFDGEETRKTKKVSFK